MVFVYFFWTHFSDFSVFQIIKLILNLKNFINYENLATVLKLTTFLSTWKQNPSQLLNLSANLTTIFNKTTFILSPLFKQIIFNTTFDLSFFARD